MNWKSILTHKAFLAAGLTVVVEVAAHFGYRVPVIPQTLVDVALTALTGFFGVSTDNAAYVQGFVEALEHAQQQAAVDQPKPAAPAAAA